MNATAQLMMRDYAAEHWPRLNHKGRIAALARTLSLGNRRVRSIYQNEPGTRIGADEMARIEALNAAADEENRNAFVALQARVARLEATLAAVDEAFFDPQVAAYRASLHGPRRTDVASGDDAADEP